MVQRQSGEVNFSTRSAQGVSQSAPGFVSPDTNYTSTQTIGGDDIARLLTGLLGVVGNIAQQGFDRSLQEAYLKGATQVGRIASEDDIESDLLTRQWAVAGFRDTMGKLKLADSEAKLAQDMLTLREQSPADMESYLNERRPELSAAASGMSFEERQNTIGKIMLNDRAAMATHNVEHKKFIIEQENVAIATEVATSIGNLNRARISGDTVAYAASRDAAAGVLYTNILANGRLPNAVKQKLAKEFLDNALATDNVDLYEHLTNNKLPDPEAEGGASSVLSRLPLEEQVALSGKYREALSRNSGLRNVQWTDQLASVKAGISSNTFDWSHDKLVNFLDAGQRQGAWSDSERSGVLKSYLEYRYKSDNLDGLALAAVAGDTTGVFRRGKTEAEAIDAIVETTRRKGLGVGDAVGQLTKAGLNGFHSAYKKAGELLAPSFRQLTRDDGTVNTDAAALIDKTFLAIESTAEAGRDNSRLQFLSGLPTDVQMRAQDIMYQMKERGSTNVQDAMIQVLQREAREAKLSPADRTAISSQSRAEFLERVNEVGPRGPLDSLWLATKATFGSTNAKTEMALRPFDSIIQLGWRSDARTVENAAGASREALIEEMPNVMRESPYASASSQYDVALARVAARTVDSKYAPVILPQGTDVVRFFGIPESGRHIVNLAVDRVVEQATASGIKPDRFEFSAAQGELVYKTFDEDGVPMGNFSIDPKEVRVALDSIMSERRKVQDERSGNGVERNVNGVRLQYNGVNTAAVDEDWMLSFRDILIRSEGVDVKVKPDLSGKIGKNGKPVMVVGVGITSENEFFPKLQPDGTVLPDDLQNSFLGASNDFASKGAAITRRVGLDSKEAFLLASELAYQAGAGHIEVPEYQRMYARLLSKDKGAAIAEFRKTRVYEVSGESRRRHYESLINKIAR